MTEIKFEGAGMTVVFTKTELLQVARKLRILAQVYPAGDELAEFQNIADILDAIATTKNLPSRK